MMPELSKAERRGGVQSSASHHAMPSSQSRPAAPQFSQAVRGIVNSIGISKSALGFRRSDIGVGASVVSWRCVLIGETWEDVTSDMSGRRSMSRPRRPLRAVGGLLLGSDAIARIEEGEARLAELLALTRIIHAVLSISIAPDGKTLASGSEDRSLRIWDIATGNQKSTMIGHSGAIEAVAFDADGTTLVSGAAEGTIKLWDLSNEREIATLRVGSHDVSSVASSGDSKSLAAGLESGAITLWYLRESVERRVLAGHRSAVYAAAFSPDSKTLASASLDGTVKLWDVATGRR